MSTRPPANPEIAGGLSDISAMTCEWDWVGVETGPFREGVAPVTLVEKGGHRVVLASTGRGLDTALEDELFDLVVADLPLLEPVLEESGGLRRWLHTYRHIENFAAGRLSESGRLVVLVSDDALPWMLAASRLKVHRLIAWQKKYSPQPDAQRLLESLHVFVAVLSTHAPATEPDVRFLSYEEGGKTEDVTRRHAEVVNAAGRQAAAPRRLKPEKLWQWLAQEHGEGVRSILDVTASGFGLGAHLSTGSRIVDVVWGADKDLHETLCLLSAQSESSNHYPQRASVACDCGELQLDSKPIQASNRSFHLEAVTPPALSKFMTVDAESAAPVSEIADRYFGQRADLVTIESPGIGIPGRALSNECAVMVRMSGDIKMGATQVLGGAPYLAPLGHVVVRDLRKPNVCVPWMVLVPWLSGDPGQRGLLRQQPWATDGDPRGRSRDPGHKGARSGGQGTAFRLHVPPYAWRTVEGELPPGFWRVNPLTGVIWGVPSEEGDWEMLVEVADSLGGTAQARVHISVLGDCDPAAAPSLDWLDPEWSTRGPLTIKPQNFVLLRGAEVSIELIAEGGIPYDGIIDPPGRPRGAGRTRYWEFSLSTFRRALAEDRAIWTGAQRAARPRIKVFERDANRKGPLVSCLVADAGGAASESELLHNSIISDVTLHLSPTSVEVVVAEPSMLFGALAARTCASCTELAPELACCMEHAVQQAGFISATQPGDMNGFPEWLGPAGISWVRGLLGGDAVVIESGVLSNQLSAEIDACVGSTTSILSSRYFTAAEASGHHERIPEFQWK